MNRVYQGKVTQVEIPRSGHPLRHDFLRRIGWGDFCRLGNGERNSTEGEGPRGPSEWERASQRGRRPDEVFAGKVSKSIMAAVSSRHGWSAWTHGADSKIAAAGGCEIKERAEAYAEL
jgi:hypothetical protein